MCAALSRYCRLDTITLLMPSLAKRTHSCTQLPQSKASQATPKTSAKHQACLWQAASRLEVQGTERAQA